MNAKTASFLLNLFLILFPLFFLPGIAPVLYSDKQNLLFLYTLLLSVIFVSGVIRDRKIALASTRLDLFFLFIILVYTISSFSLSPYPYGSFAYPFATGFLTVIFLFYFLLNQYLHLNPSLLKPALLYIPGMILGVLGMLTALPLVPKTLSSYLLYPVGDFVNLAIFLTVITSYWFAHRFFSYTKTKKTVRYHLLSIVSLLPLLGGLGVSVYRLFTDQKFYALPFQFAWFILLETYKNFANFLLGISPANFRLAFYQGKTALFNNTPLWNTDFILSSNLPFHLATEGGFLVLLAFVAIIFLAYRSISSENKRELLPAKVALIASFILSLLLPPNLFVLFFLMIFLSLLMPKRTLFKVNLPKPKLFSVLGIIVSGALVYLLTLTLASDFLIRKVRKKLDVKNPPQYFPLIQTAIRLNPQSETALYLASNLTFSYARILSQQPQATDSAKVIAQLAQQAVDLAQETTRLNRVNPRNWSTLGAYYQALIGTADKADQYALQAFQEEVRLDPFNPRPKVNIGGLLMNLERYEEAGNYLVMAASLKPDWNTAHYNLGLLFARMGNMEKALDELEKTKALTQESDPDYQKLLSEIEQVKQMLPPEKDSSQSALPAPSPTPTPKKVK